MRGIGRLFQPPEAVAGGDHATAETEPEIRAQSRMSEDGDWWWDGERWVATGTPDGLWRWDGACWRPTIELRGVRARDLATTLALLAEDRYARGAAILVERSREWRPQGELGDLVEDARALRRRLLRAERAFTGSAAGPPGLLRRMRAQPEDRQRVEEEQVLLDTQYRGLMVRLGRGAPRPSLKEADDMLEVARLLDRRASRITEALAAADQAELARVHAIDAARRDLAGAEAARRREVEAAERALATAERARDEERRAARARFRAALEPPDGREPLAEVGPLRAHATHLDTPAGRLDVCGAHAWAGSAVALWRQQRDLLEDVLLPDTAEAGEFLRCLTERRRDLFLLVAARSRTLTWRCPAGEEKPLRQFVTAVNRQGGRPGDGAADRLQAADALLAELRRRDTARPQEAARAALDRAEADRRLAGAVAAARARLDRARQEPAELVAARRQAAAETAAVSTPPAPLA